MRRKLTKRATAIAAFGVIGALTFAVSQSTPNRHVRLSQGTTTNDELDNGLMSTTLTVTRREPGHPTAGKDDTSGEITFTYDPSIIPDYGHVLLDDVHPSAGQIAVGGQVYGAGDLILDVVFDNGAPTSFIFSPGIPSPGTRCQPPESSIRIIS